jgi:hypothetical protein
MGLTGGLVTALLVNEWMASAIPAIAVSSFVALLGLQILLRSVAALTGADRARERIDHVWDLLTLRREPQPATLPVRPGRSSLQAVARRRGTPRRSDG